MNTAVAAKPHDSPRGDCPLCRGTGLEPQLNRKSGRVQLVGCFWCSGSGYLEFGTAPVCPCCGREVTLVDGEGVCPDCSRFEVTH